MKQPSSLPPLITAALLVGFAGNAKGNHELRQGPVEPPRGASQPLRPCDSAPVDTSANPGVIPAVPRIDARLLILSADGQEADLPAIQQALDYLGTPYTVWIASQKPGQLLPAQLASGDHAFYQGVLLTTGSLAYADNGTWHSALSPAEWSALYGFEAMFHLRQVTWYTYPTADFGLGAPSELDTSKTPLPSTLTPAGRGVFPYLNAATPVRFQSAYCYRAQAASPDTTPLLVDAAGAALASVRVYPDGRENLALTCDSAPWLVHSVVLSYGVINWVTRGRFVGYRRVYASAQVDDLFIEDDLFTGGVYRMTGEDMLRTASWQGGFRRLPLAAGFRLELAFNGEGAEPGYWSRDTLVSAARQQQSHFKWISHTYTHANLDAINQADTRSELTQNLATGAWLRLTTFSGDALVTPDISGLSNPDAMRAAADVGVRFVVSDTSRPGQGNPVPNVGLVNAVDPRVFEVPRRPTNLFYNVTTPEQWRAEYNAFYRSYWGRDLSYAELLDKESDVLLLYLLKGENDPWMFHQTNLRAYNGDSSLLSDLLEQVMAKYQALYQLPWVSPTLSELGQQVSIRTRNQGAGITASFSGNTITVTAQRDAQVPVTGLSSSGASVYGGQPTTFVNVAAGQSVTLPLQ